MISLCGHLFSDHNVKEAVVKTEEFDSANLVGVGFTILISEVIFEL